MSKQISARIMGMLLLTFAIIIKLVSCCLKVGALSCLLLLNE